jgi:hypothetical protein
VSAVVAAIVRDAILQTNAIVSVLGTSVNPRIYASYRAASVLPAIVVTYGDDNDLSPTFARTDCLRKLTVSVDCIGSTLKESRELAELCRVALHGASGYYRSTRVFEMRVLSTSTQYDIGGDANDVQAHITTVQVECTYRAPTVSPTTITDPNAAP